METPLSKHLLPQVPPAGPPAALAAESECPGRESFNLGVEDWSGFPGFPRDTWVATDILDGAGPLLDTATAKEPLWKAGRRRFASCQDTRLREAGVEAVYCLARGAPKGPNIPRAQLNHQGPLFPGHGYATHSQTWVGEPTWLGVRSDATHQAPTKVGAPCVRVWWPTWLGSVVTLLTKHLAPKVQAPPAGLGVRGDATLQTPAFTEGFCFRLESPEAEGVDSDLQRRASSSDLDPASSMGSSAAAGSWTLEVDCLGTSPGFLWGAEVWGARTPVCRRQGPKWCVASPGGPRRVQTYPGLSSTTNMPFSLDKGSPRTARRGPLQPTHLQPEPPEPSPRQPCPPCYNLKLLEPSPQQPCQPRCNLKPLEPSPWTPHLPRCLKPPGPSPWQHHPPCIPKPNLWQPHNNLKPPEPSPWQPHPPCYRKSPEPSLRQPCPSRYFKLPGPYPLRPRPPRCNLKLPEPSSLQSSPPCYSLKSSQPWVVWPRHFHFSRPTLCTRYTGTRCLADAIGAPRLRVTDENDDLCIVGAASDNAFQSSSDIRK
ncbi:hypothetical protein ISCGN_002378 [Ixodes scapularis]